MTSFLKKHTSYIFSFLFVLGILFSITTYAAPTQQTLGFQGEFFNYGTPGNAPVQATFTFHTTETGNTPSGSTITKIIPVVHGYFATEFTDTDTQGVDFNQQLYLEISINGTTLSPRTPVRPSVASFKTFGTFSHATPPTPGIAGSLYFNTTTNELYVSTGSSWQLAGTASTTIQWTPNGTSLNYMAGNVGVGTSTPVQKLTVVGSSLFEYGDGTRFYSNEGGSTVEDTVNPVGFTMKGAGGGGNAVYMFMQDTGSSDMGYLTYNKNAGSISGIGINRYDSGTNTYISQAQFLKDGNIILGDRLLSAGSAGTAKINLYSVSTMVGLNTIGPTPVATLDVRGFPGLDPFSVASSSGASLFTVGANGGVGIGTTSLSNMLTIQNTTSGANRYVSIVNAEPNSGTLRLGAAFGAPGIVAGEVGKSLILGSGGGSGSNVSFVVGVGASGFGTAGTFYSDAIGGGLALGIGSTYTGGNGVQYPELKGTDISGGLNQSGYGLVIRGGSGSGTGTGGDLVFKTTPPGGSSGSTTNTPVERMRILANGDMGIGTNNPAFRLEIKPSSNLPQLQLSQDNSPLGWAFHADSTDGSLRFVRAGTTHMRLYSGTLETPAINASGDIIGNNFKLNAGFKVDFSNGSTIERIVSDGHMKYSSQNNIHEFVGNIGIGTASPNAKLEVVVADGSSQYGGRFTASANQAQLQLVGTYGLIDNTNGHFYINNSANSDLVFRTGVSSEKMRILANGNVGVGTTTPNEKLSVIGNAAFSGTLTTSDFSTVGGNLTLTGAISDDKGIYATAFSVPIYSLTRQNNDIAISGYGGVGFNTNDTTGSPDANYEVYINSLGSLGIGTTTPTRKLSVAGTQLVTGTAYFGADSGTQIGNAGVNIYNANFPFVNFTNNTSSSTAALKGFRIGIEGAQNLAYIDQLENAAIVFRTNTNSKMAISATGGLSLGNAYVSTDAGAGNFIMTGNLGVGTTTPGAKLDVYGTSGDVFRVLGASGSTLRMSNTGNPTLTINDPGQPGNGSLSLISGPGSNSAFASSSGRFIISAWGSEKVRVSTNGVAINTSGTDAGAGASLVIGTGNLGIGTTTPLSKLSVVGNIASTDLLGGITTLSVDANGNIIRTPSDQSLKTNIETLTSALEKVNQIRGVRYNWIDTTRFGSSSEIGFIAQELETVVPEVVKSGGEYKSVNYQNMVALLVEAVKELSTKFDSVNSWFKNGTFNVQNDVCVDDFCVTKEEFKSMLMNAKNGGNTNKINIISEPEPETNEPVLVPEPETQPTQEPIIEPSSEPISEEL